MSTTDKDRLQRIQGRSDVIRALQVGQFVEVPIRRKYTDDYRDYNNVRSLCGHLAIDFGVKFAIRTGSAIDKLFVLRLQ